MSALFPLSNIHSFPQFDIANQACFMIFYAPILNYFFKDTLKFPVQIKNLLKTSKTLLNTNTDGAVGVKIHKHILRTAVINI